MQLQLTVDDFAKVEDFAVGKIFDKLTVWGGGDQMNMQIMKPVWTHRHSITIGQSGDPAKFGYPSADGSVRLEDRSGLFVEQFLASPATSFNFASCDGGTDGCCKFGVVVDLIGTKRLFDPIWIIGREASHVSQCCRDIGPCVVCIKHEQHVGSDRLSRGSYSGLFGFEIASSYFHFHGAKSERYIAGHLFA